MLIESIKRVALVTDRVAQVRMEFADDGLRLTAGGDDVGSAEEELPCELEGAPLTIAFNPGYLLDALGVLHVERAQLTFTTPNRPALVRPVPPPPAEGSDEAGARRRRCRATSTCPDARPAARLIGLVHLRRLAVTRLPLLGGGRAGPHPGDHGPRRPQRRRQDQPRRGRGLPGHARLAPRRHRRAADPPGRARRPSSAGRWCTWAASCRSRWRSPSGRANRARVNRAPAKPRDVLGILRTVLFAPEDLALVRGDPGERRRFLDELLVTRYPRYASVRADYDRVLRQRTALLKSARSGGDLRTLDVWDGHLATHGAALLAGRLELVAAIAPPAVAAFAEVAPSSPPIGADLPLLGRHRAAGRRWSPRCWRRWRAMRRQEVERGVCLVGPHRDDLELASATGPPRGTRATASRGRWRSRSGWRPTGCCATTTSSPSSSSTTCSPSSTPAAAARSPRSPARAEQVLVTAAVDEDVPDGARRRPLHGG